MGNIFLSYRREDTSGYAGRLFDRLAQHFGREHVFMDVSHIEAGVDFVESINKALSTSDVFLVFIGKDWLTCKDESGRRRIDDPNDFIRLETSTALKRNIRVIPVLVKNASMPSSLDLPEDMAALARRQAHELSDQRWDFDCGELIKVLEKTIGPVAKTGGLQERSDLKKESPGEPDHTVQKYSTKAIAGLVITLLIFIAYGTDELTDTESLSGAVAIALGGLVLGIIAFFDIKSQKAKGRNLAITVVGLSSLLIIMLLGDMTGNSHDNGYSVQQPVAVAGTWYGSDGMYYAIEQQGNALRIGGVNAAQQFLLSGGGTINGQHIQISFNYADGSGGSAQLTVTPDGQSMSGNFTQHATGFTGGITLNRFAGTR